MLGFFLRCGSNQNESPNVTVQGPVSHQVHLIQPNDASVWHGGECCDTIRWTGAKGDSVQLRVYRDTSLLPYYLDEFTENDSIYVTESVIPRSWKSDSRYQIQIIDWNGNVGWSSPFTVEADTLAVMDVITPNRFSVVQSGENLGKIEWLHDPIGSDSVAIDLYKKGAFVALLESAVANDGLHDDGLSMDFTYGYGDGYQIRIVGTDGRYGWSEPFRILPDECGRMAVTLPDSTTVWKQSQEGLVIQWDSLCGGNVRIELYADGEFVQTLASSVSTDSYALETPVLHEWGVGDNFQIRVLDQCGHIGYSGFFSIAADSLERLEVLVPDNETTWRWGQRSPVVQWRGSDGQSFTFILYDDDVLLDTLAKSVSADSIVPLADSVSSDWAKGTEYTLKVIDNTGAFGWSTPFMIDSDPGLSVFAPNEETVWLHGDTVVQVAWSGSADSVLVELYKADVLLDTVVHRTEGVSGLGLDSTVQRQWGQGEDYKIRIEGADGKHGWSEEFSILRDTVPSFVVESPDSNSIWFLGQDSLRVRIQSLVPDSMRGDSLTIELYQGAVSKSFLARNAPYDTLVILEDPLESFLSESSTYRIRVSDEEYNYGWSSFFEIRADTSRIITVDRPDSSDFIYVGQQNVPVSWQGSGGDSVAVLMYRHESLVDTFISWLPDTGSAQRVSGVPSAYGTGDGFRLRVVERSGTYGISDPFRIWSDSLERIVVTSPTSSNFWRSGETDVLVAWEGYCPDSVTVELYNNSSYLGIFSTCSGDTLDSCTRDEPLPVYWGTGSGFRVKVVAGDGRYGWSESFFISASPVSDE